MPAMPRPDDKARKIAYKILGLPGNMRKKSKREIQLDEYLKYDESRRVK
jgi:hypothetical protein